MKTNHFDMDLMVPNQPNKDIVFNEALLTIDNFLGITVDGILTSTPDEIVVGTKYIITNGDYRNCICYRTQESKATEYYHPQNGALFFSLESHNFMLYNNNSWEEIQLNSGGGTPFYTAQAATAASTTETNFTGTNDEFIATENKPYFYLYLNNNSTMNFDQITLSEITIIIKQCHNASYTITWPYNILWENRTPHVITGTPNATDIIKLYRLPETTHFLGKIIAQNFQF